MQKFLFRSRALLAFSSHAMKAFGANAAGNVVMRIALDAMGVITLPKTPSRELS
jgi:hypothetical protein